MSISRNKISLLFAICVILTVTLNCTQDVETVSQLDLMLADGFWIFIDNVTSISNYLLFVIFGYLLFDNNNTPKEQLKGVLVKLLIPYLVWQLVMTVAKVVVLGQDFASLQFIKTVFLFGAWPPNGPMYLMYPMILFGVLSPILAPLFKNSKNHFSLVFSILLSGLLIFVYKLQLFPKELTINSCLFLVNGTILGSYIVANKNNKSIIYDLLLYITFTYVFVIIFKMNNSLVINVTLSTVLLWLPFGNNTSFKSTNWFIVYAIHPVLIVMVLPIIQSLFAYGILKNVCGSIVVVTISYLVAIVSNYFIKLINKLINKESSIFNLITTDFHK